MLYINGRFLTQPVTGVQRYSHELLTAIDRILTQETQASTPLITCLAPSDASEVASWKSIQLEKTGRLSGNLWEQFELPLSARQGMLFSPANIGPYLLDGQVVTIHDPSVFAFPQAYSTAFRLKYRTILSRLGKTSRKVITVSEFARRELTHWCGIAPEKIVVIYEGCEHILRTRSVHSVFDKHSIGENAYFLAVGSQSVHKNFTAAISAYVNSDFPHTDLVITGGNFNRVFHYSSRNKPSGCIETGYINDAELRALYENAVGLIFPSLYEGFGLPPLEAMACGCPVICSSAASMPEICGDAVLYCDPNDTKDISRQMHLLQANPGLRAELREKGLAHAQKFSWARAAEQTWELMKALQAAG